MPAILAQQQQQVLDQPDTLALVSEEHAIQEILLAIESWNFSFRPDFQLPFESADKLQLPQSWRK